MCRWMYKLWANSGRWGEGDGDPFPRSHGQATAVRLTQGFVGLDEIAPRIGGVLLYSIVL
jgi:hypothetical protein